MPSRHSPLSVAVLRKRVGEKYAARTQAPVLDVVGKGRYRIPLDDLDVSQASHLKPRQRRRYARFVHLLQEPERTTKSTHGMVTRFYDTLPKNCWLSPQKPCSYGLDQYGTWRALGSGRNGFEHEDNNN